MSFYGFFGICNQNRILVAHSWICNMFYQSKENLRLENNRQKHDLLAEIGQFSDSLPPKQSFCLFLLYFGIFPVFPMLFNSKFQIRKKFNLRHLFSIALSPSPPALLPLEGCFSVSRNPTLIFTSPTRKQQNNQFYYININVIQNRIYRMDIYLGKLNLISTTEREIFAHVKIGVNVERRLCCRRNLISELADINTQ